MDEADEMAAASSRDLTGNSSDDCWFDADPALRKITEQLQHGQMFHSEHFNLFEAMSAVEIGDPKMDAALDTATAPTPEELIDRGVAPLQLSIPQLIATLDKLAIMQASWHTGNSLAQTVFVCLYMLKPDRRVVVQTQLADCYSSITRIAYIYRTGSTVLALTGLLRINPSQRTVEQPAQAAMLSEMLSCRLQYVR